MNKFNFDYPNLMGAPEQKLTQLEVFLYKLVDLLNLKENTEFGGKTSSKTTESISDQSVVIEHKGGISILEIGDILIQFGNTSTGNNEYENSSAGQTTEGQTISVTDRYNDTKETGVFKNHQSLFKTPEILFPKAFKTAPQIYISATGYFLGATDFLIYDFFADEVQNDSFRIKSRVVSIGAVIGTREFDGIGLSWLAIGTKGE
mgnify:FL=1